jgi:basic amino acid/polyamine antiporter, APA family
MPPSAAPRRELTLLDSTCIIVGIIVAAGIYETSPGIAARAGSFTILIALWLLGGLLSLLGALCYAELATAYPRAGGDYVYLTRALGRSVGFLFAWCQLWIVRPGSIGAMAYIFADYANRIWPNVGGESSDYAYVLLAYAVGSVLALTAINMLGVREGKWTQNVLTTAKVLGLAVIVAVGFAYAASSVPARCVRPSPPSFSNLGMAMVFVLFTYGGWNEMAFVAAEVKEPRKNILRALLIGTLAVTAIYVLVTLAFVHALGFEGLCATGAVAADVLTLGIGPPAGKAVSALVCISVLGAINGQIFTGSRIYYAMGSEHRLYAWLGRWNARRGGPLCSLVVQCLITVALMLWFGMGRSGFESMVKFTTPGFWTFMALVGVSVFVLRSREPAVERPYRVPGYPVTPLVFCLSCDCVIYSSVKYAIDNRSWEAIWSIAILLAGVAACWVNARWGVKDERPIAP